MKSDGAAATGGGRGGGGTATAATATSLTAADSDGPPVLPNSPRKRVDFAGKTILAPLTTVGNLPFRRIAKGYGVNITVGEMAMAQNLLQGTSAEWSLVRRHESEDIFGVQIAGSKPQIVARACELLQAEGNVDFVDLNCGCPIDLVCRTGAGSALMGNNGRFGKIVRAMRAVLTDTSLTIKLRTGIKTGKNTAMKLVPQLKIWNVDLITMHGRSKEARYTKLADWDYISQCARAAAPIPFAGNGDILSWEDANRGRDGTGISSVMIGRGALIKPWIFKEIEDQQHYDIRSGERLDMLRDYCRYGMEHWGSDTKGVETTRKFLLEWMSFLHRYIPVGLLEVLPQRINERPPAHYCRDDLETMMASNHSEDWVKITNMLLGPPPKTFEFVPKHKSNSYNNNPDVVAAAAAPGGGGGGGGGGSKVVKEWG